MKCFITETVMSGYRGGGARKWVNNFSKSGGRAVELQVPNSLFEQEHCYGAVLGKDHGSRQIFVTLE